jgi:hypothetical protein
MPSSLTKADARANSIMWRSRRATLCRRSQWRQKFIGYQRFQRRHSWRGIGERQRTISDRRHFAIRPGHGRRP